MTAPPDARNVLLAALPAEESAGLGPSLEPVTCSTGTVLTESGRGTPHVYFPTACMAALIYTTADGSSSAMGIVGNDGLVGVNAFLGGDALPGRAVVLIDGCAFRMDAQVLRDRFGRGGTLQRVLLRYTHALMVQISQTAVCQGLHSVEQRLARCILLALDRSSFSEDLALTQDSLAMMLGVRRESVSHAAGQLQAAGCLRCIRGHVRVIDRHRLEQAGCECYRVIKSESLIHAPMASIVGASRNKEP